MRLLATLLIFSALIAAGAAQELRIIRLQNGFQFELTLLGSKPQRLESGNEVQSQIAKTKQRPSRIELVVPDGSTLEAVYHAVTALHAAGIREVRYTGCIPPGCSILTGATSDQKRLKRKPMKSADLVRIVEENSVKC